MEEAPPARILVNPHLQQCPDYDAPEYEDIRDALTAVDNPIPPADRLRAAWQAGNDAKKAAWDQQEEEDRARAQDNLRRSHSPTPPPADPNAPGPNAAPFVPGTKVGLLAERISSYARSRLLSKSYLELFYCTKEGMQLTKSSNISLGDSDAYGIISTNDGLQFKPVSDFKAYKKAIPDENLAWHQVGDTLPVFLREIAALGWDPLIVEAFHGFYYRLNMHLVREKDYGDLVIVQYQADVRREWHYRLEQKKPLFDISVIDEDHMLICEDKVRHRLHREERQQHKERIETVC